MANSKKEPTSGFDTLRAARDLASAGIDQKHAEAIVKFVGNSHEGLVTKSDIRDTQSDIRDTQSDIQDLRREFENYRQMTEAKFEALEHRFSGLGHRLDAVNHRLDGVDHRFDALDSKLSVMMWAMGILAAIVLADIARSLF